MAKKNKFPKKLIVILDDEGMPISFETPEDISDTLAGEPAAIYELVTTGKFNVEKSFSGKTPK